MIDQVEPFHLEMIPIEQLIEDHPHLNDPIVDGWFRREETVNVIANPKVGKSWFAYLLSLTIITGRDLFGKFPTTPGRVWLVDNELHRNVLSNRIPKVAAAMGLSTEDYRGRLVVTPLRGNCRSIQELLVGATNVMPGEFDVIVIDSKYRMGDGKTSENDNAHETQFYNAVDRLAEITKAAVVLIHHSSKGDQSGKRVTDVGSGAGAQSRAADCHLVLREHEESDVHVIEGAVRSFAPFEPIAIRWQYPLWEADQWADPAKLKGRLPASEERQLAKDKEGRDAIVNALLAGPLTVNDLTKKAGMGKERFNRLVGKLEEDGHVYTSTTKVAHNDATLYHLNDSDLEGGPEAWTTWTDHQTA